MRRVRYGIGMTLDACIADAADEMDWMVGDPAYDSRPFFASIDTVLMGRRSFQVMLRHGARAYPRLHNYVFSRTLIPADYPEVTIVAEDGVATVAKLRQGPGKDIWLTGGGQLFHSLLEADLVDTVELGISPILLGRGIPLLPPPARSVHLELTHQETFPSGLVVLHYAVRRPAV